MMEMALKDISEAGRREAERKRILAARNKMLAFVLLGFVVLFFAITIVKRDQHNKAQDQAAAAPAGQPVPAKQG